jgi:hypothetical protein
VRSPLNVKFVAADPFRRSLLGMNTSNAQPSLDTRLATR